MSRFFPITVLNQHLQKKFLKRYNLQTSLKGSQIIYPFFIMQNIKISFIWFFIFHHTLSKCDQGTLSCQTQGEKSIPKICDFINNYIFDPVQNQCIKQQIQGCEISSFTNSSSCLVCEPGKVFDLVSEKCIDIPSNEKIFGCSRYVIDSKQCLECEKGYYVSHGRCLTLGDQKIENCLKYASPSKCEICDEGFYLNDSSCFEISDEPNCAVLTKFYCSECEENYFLNRGNNSEVDITQTFDTIQRKILNSFGVSLNQDKNLNSVCLKTTVPNCKKFQNLDSCSECVENHYLTEAGLCSLFPEDPVANCTEYANALTCTKCQNSFHMISPTECKKSSDVKHCQLYSESQDKCVQCAPNYWLDDGNQTCVLRQNLEIQHCQENNLLADSCSRCEEWYSPTQDGLLCLPDINFCQDQTQGVDKDSTHHTCNLCNDGHFKETNSCKPQSIPNCSKYVSNLNQCQTCENGFFHYPDRSVCAQQSIAYCQEYVQNSTNTCSKCENLKYLNATNSACLDIDNFTHCFLSDGLTNKCIECLPGFFFNGVTCSGLRSFQIFDKNCLSNTDTYLTSTCTRCGDNYAPLIGTFPAVIKDYFVSNPNCLRIHPLSGQCNQCTDFYELNDDNDCEYLANQSDLVCKRTILGKMQLLKENLYCEACKDQTFQYLHEARCLDRSNYTNFSGCALNPETSDNQCTGCESDKYTVPVNTHPQCVSSDIGFYFWPPQIPNCLIRDGKGKCFLCQPGTYLTTDRMSCISLDPANNATIWNAFDNKMEPIGSIQSPEHLIENCEEYGQIDPTKIGCTKCKSGFVGIIPQQSSTRTGNLDITISLNDRVDTMDFWHPFDECYDNSKILRTNASTNHVNANDCEFGFRIDEREGYGCLRCLNNKIGQVLSVLYDSDGIYLHTNYQVIGNCQTTSIKSELTGIGFLNRSTLSRLQWNILMPFTNCASWGYADSEVLVYMYLTDFLNPYVQLNSFDDEYPHPDEPIEQAYCFPTARVNNQISHCQIYSISSLIPNFNSSTSVIQNPHCLACEPGYAPVFDVNDQYITQCQIIPNCTTSSHNSNTWLNACESPTFDAWKVEVINGSQVIAFDEPVSTSEAIGNCEVIDTSASSDLCVLCEAGYTLVDNACELIEVGNFLCENRGMGYTGVSDSLVAVPSLHFNSFAHLRFANKNSAYLDYVHPLCNSCLGSEILFIDSENAAAKVCGKSIFVESSDHIPSDCKYPAFNNPLKCAECEPNFLLVTPSLECVPQSSFPNCSTVIFSGISNACTSCQKGFYFSSGSCLPTNCLEFSAANSDECAVCKESYKIDPSSKQRCILDAGSPAPCKLYSPTLDHCISCQDSSKLVHLFVKKGSSDVIEGFECVEFSIEGNGFENYNLDYPYIQIEIASDNNIEIYLKRVETENQIFRTFAHKSPTINPAHSHCLPKRNIPHCKTDSILENAYCLKCEDYYFLQTSDNQCVSGSITKCREYSNNASQCLRCDNGYYLSSNSQACILRDNTSNCEEFIIDADSCSKCQQGFRLDLSTMTCQEYSANFCKEFHPNINQCTSCQHEAWKEVIGDQVLCKTYSAQHCATFDLYRDRCSSCNDQGYPTTLPDGSLLCKQRTISNCETVDPLTDDCLLCEQGAYYSTSSQSCIIHRNIEYCSEYSRISPDCTVCDAGFYYNETHQECFEYPAGILGCAVYEKKDRCGKCRKEYYLDGGSCSLVESVIAGCAEYTSASACAECESGKVLVGNECKTTTLTNCSVFLNEAACDVCAENYILNSENKTCEYSNIANCTSAIKGNPNTCTKCQAPFVLSFDKTACNYPKTDIKNCVEYASEIKCQKCNSGYILSENGFECLEMNERAGAYCSYGRTTNSAFCDSCKLGFDKNDDGVCVPLKTKSCWVWNYTDNRCELCMIGTYMNSSFDCVDVPIVVISDNGVVDIFWSVILIIGLLYVLD